MKKSQINDIAGINVKHLDELQNDNVYVNASIVTLESLTGMKSASNLRNAIISEGKIVNVVSDSYGMLTNEKLFLEVEHKLIDQDIEYVTRSINREDKHFAVDYILSDDKYQINVKEGLDKIRPMLRFTNSYAGGPTTGKFGFFREVCSNGLHVAQSKIGFGVRHKPNVVEIVMPNIKELVAKFMDNEFYQLRRKFEVLAERPIGDLSEFVKFTCSALDLFKYEASEKNPNEPSKNAKIVMDTITKESNILGVEPNMWLGYNAFNEFIHAGKKSFMKQQSTDIKLFDAVLEMAN